MFTGLITDMGRIRQIEARAGLTWASIATAWSLDDVALGASIACGGPCLTVVEKGPDWFAVELAPETLARTNWGAKREGDAINLERSLTLSAELGGHLVTGHIDGLAVIRDARVEGESRRFRIDAPTELARFIATKGSVALDGISLTVAHAEGTGFEVMLIPHTLAHTTAGSWAIGDHLNLEVDLMARYAQRLLEVEPTGRVAAA